MTVLTPPAPAPLVGEGATAPRDRAARARTWPAAGTLTRLAGLGEHLLLAALAFVPLLVVRPGVATPDTKTYLYLDPSRFLSQVADMWNPTVGLGTVTHEYIGYLLPMGPFFWFFHVLGVPVWAAQRLWLGSILFAAAAGVVYLCRVLSVGGPGRVVAATAFMLSPYFLQYAGRISVILLPWAGLPWMVAFAAMALRRPGWRYPALFAVVVALVSGINASSIIYVGVAPVLWIVYAVAVERQVPVRRALWVTLKIGVLTLAVCLWWIAGLAVEAAYGVNVLKYTETIPSTSATSNPSEVIRGLGYWYFYGGDRLGPWTNSSVLYTQTLWLLAASYAVPVLSFLAAVLVRWRHRAYFVLLVVVGMVLSVGAYPFTHPTPLGGLLKAFMSDTTAGLAMRSTDRATPLVVLGLAMLLGAGVSAAWRRLPAFGLVVGTLVLALAVANNPAIFNGDTIANDFSQPATLPSPEMQAIAHLNATHQGYRVLAIPGDDFSSYRWGNTVDTPQPAYLDRPFAIREQQVMGSIATADTLYALDDPIQEDTENWNALAPMARLLSAGDVLVENDQQYEHFGIPQPQLLALQLATTPKGLSDPVSYGAPVPNVSQVSTLDEQDLAAPSDVAWPEPLVSYTVTAPRPITRAESDQGALVVSGDATGLEDVAGTGLLDTASAIYYAGTLDGHPAQLRDLLRQGAALVVTDTNRKQAFRWDTLSANTGLTETPSQNPANTDPSDSPIDLFPGAPLGSKTVAGFTGAVNVTASSYGNTVSYTPEDRAYSAIDGNLDTAWETGTFVPDPAGQWWQVRYQSPVTADHVTLVQPQRGDLTRHLTRVTLTFDGGSPVVVQLGPASLQPAGQVVRFPARSFRTLRITIDRTSNDTAAVPSAAAVGFAEVEVPGQHVVEVVQMPDDALRAAGTSSLANRLTVVMTRLRTSPFPPRTDPETDIVRQFDLPTARTFTVSGLAGLSPLIPDDEIDRLVGRPGANGSGVVAYSQGRLPGDLTAGAASAADGDLSTVWQPGLGKAHQAGEWLAYTLPAPITFDHMDLQVVADGRHSVPTQITVATEHGSRTLALPPIADSAVPGATVAVPLTFPALHGSHVRVTVDKVRLENTTNYYSSSPLALPLGIAEVGIPGIHVPPVAPAVPVACRNDLVAIDGHPVPVAVEGSSVSALSNGELPLVPCGADAHGITLGPGPHVVQTAVGHQVGWDVDQLVLDSAPGGAAGPGPVRGALPATQPGPAPTVQVTGQGLSSQNATVHGATAPFELVLGQSINAGWQATAEPAKGAPPGSQPVDLGPPHLVDGFANGWSVSAGTLARLGALGATGGGTFTLQLRWTPQTRVWIALGLSAVALATCLVLAILPRRLFRRRTGDGGRRRARSTRSRARHAQGASAEPAATPPPPPEGYATVPSAAAAPAATLSVADLRDAGLVEAAALDPLRAPRLALPFLRRGRRPSWWMCVLVAALTGGAAAGICAPLVGLAAGVATLAALLVPQARLVTAGAAVGLLAAAGVLVVRGQALHPLPESSNWPAAFASAGLLVWMAVVFLGADAVAETAREMAARRTRRREHRRQAAGADGTAV